MLFTNLFIELNFSLLSELLGKKGDLRTSATFNNY